MDNFSSRFHRRIYPSMALFHLGQETGELLRAIGCGQLPRAPVSMASSVKYSCFYLRQMSSARSRPFSPPEQCRTTNTCQARLFEPPPTLAKAALHGTSFDPCIQNLGRMTDQAKHQLSCSEANEDEDRLALEGPTRTTKP
jgi:hypothetical protein